MTQGRAQRVLFVVALVVVATGGAMAVAGTGSNEQTTERSAMSLQQETTTNVTFENQTSNGTEVTVAAANLSEGGFVSVHTAELLNGSVLESIIGTSAYLEPGAHENVTVTLDEPINESGAFIAVAYQDTNGNEAYDFLDSQGETDGAYVAENQVVLDSAEVTYDPTLAETPEPTTEAPEPTETTEAVATTEEPPATTEEPEIPTTVETAEAVETTTEAPETTVEAPETETETETETPVVGEPTTEVATEPAPEPTTEAATETETPDSERAQSFRVGEAQAPVSIAAGETASVTAVISNPTDAEATQRVELRLQGDVVAERSVTIEGGGQTTVEFELDTDGIEPDTYVVEVFTEYFGDARLVAVEEPEATEESTADA